MNKDEKEALSQCNNWVNLPPFIGYFSFKAANFLVGTGKYKFQQAGWMGYVLEKIDKQKSFETGEDFGCIHHEK